MSSKTIIKLDASALRESACDLRLHNIILKGYTSGGVTNDILYGSAVHRFIEVMFTSGGKLNEAMAAAKATYSLPNIVKPKKQYLTMNHLFQTCITIWQTYLEKDNFDYFIIDGKPAVEYKFSISIYEDEHVIIFLEGTMDKIGKIKHGCVSIGDYKTTASFNKEEYLSSYILSPQLKTYAYAFLSMAQHKEHPFYGITQVGTFIDGIFLSPTNQVSHKRSEVFVYKMDDLIEFDTMLEQLCLKISRWVGDKIIPYATGQLNGACETKYGKCRYFNVCAAPDDIARGHLIKRDFKIKPYEPLKFNE